MKTTDTLARPDRYFELDSLRGLASLTVVFYHIRLLWVEESQPSSGFLHALLRFTTPFGNESVILFFVLSGFVLSLPAAAGRPQPYLTFVTRRVFRIYVPYLVALATSVAGAYWLHGIITRSEWFHMSWSEPLDWRLVGQHLIFVGYYDSAQFDNPIWSLIYEMRISLLFPFLCALVLRLKSRWSLLVAAGLTAISVEIQKPPFRIPLEPATSFHYAGLFVLGILLVREKHRLDEWFRRPRQLWRALIIVFFLWLFLFAGPPLVPHHSQFLRFSIQRISQWVTAFGAGGVIIASLNSQFLKRILHWRPIHFLGEISYSLYLWHVIVMLYCVHLLYGRAPLAAILCLVAVLSIVVAWGSYHLIEVPSIRIGRRLSNSFQRRVQSRGLRGPSHSTSSVSS